MKKIVLLVLCFLFIGCGNHEILESRIENIESKLGISKKHVKFPSKKLTLNEKCLVLLDREIKDDPGDYELLDVETFWSKSLETCLLVEINEIDFDYTIRDLSGNFMNGGIVDWIFYCNEKSITSVNFEVVKAYKGYVDDIPYDQWSIYEEVEGGLTRQQCEKEIKKYIQKQN